MKKLIQMDNEEWRAVAGFPGYWVSDLGRCKRVGVNGDFELSGKKDRLGYQQFGLCKQGKQQWFLAHRLIASVFLNPPDVPEGQFMTVNHKNRIRDDNRVVNLELMTVQDNHRHWRKHNLAKLSVLD